MAGRPPTKEAPSFGKQLAYYRKKKGLSQVQFGKLTGKSREMIDYYERRAKNPTMSFILKASEALGVPVNKLLSARTGSK